MSKYIRIKEGIFDIKNKEIFNNLEGYFIRKEDKFKFVLAEEIIKESDNLEDLIDEFIGIYKNQGLEPHFIETTLKSLIEETKKYCYDNTTLDDLNIYGAIWTNKGLIFVAKMNENGELRLI